MGGARARWLAGTAFGAGVAACFSPAPATGLPCTAELECPAGQRCDLTAPAGPTCLPFGGLVPDAPAAADGPPVIDAPGAPDAPRVPDAPPGTPDAFIPVVANDVPAGAVDVSGGGTFMWDVGLLANDFPATCTGGGGSDLFFRISINQPEVIYLDTLGSAYDSVIIIKPGECTETSTPTACVDDSCNGPNAQGAWNLAAGVHCIVVDAKGSAATGTGQLTVVRGGHAGAELTGGAGTVTGNTCNGNDDNMPAQSCATCPAAQDDHWFFTVCPGQMFNADADTCTAPAYDSVLQIRSATGTSLTCEDGDQCGSGSENVSVAISQPGMYWIVVDGCGGCGTYTLTYNF